MPGKIGLHFLAAWETEIRGERVRTGLMRRSPPAGNGAGANRAGGVRKPQKPSRW